MKVKATGIWTSLAGLFGLSGVALGAVAAHAVAETHAAAMLQRAAEYQVIHAGVLLALSLAGPGALHPRLLLAARVFFVLGILGFSGGIALHYLAGVGPALHLAPVGGTCLMIGWAALIPAPFFRPPPPPSA